MVSFAYAGYINLYWQAGILVVLGLVGFAGFTAVDVRNTQKRNKADTQTEMETESEEKKEKLSFDRTSQLSLENRVVGKGG